MIELSCSDAEMATMVVIAVCTVVGAGATRYLLSGTRGGPGTTSDHTPDHARFLDLARRRRSVFPKDYIPGGKVTEEEIAMLLEAANWAPTHGKTEPWRFVVLEGECIAQFADIGAAFISADLEGDALQSFREKAKRKRGDKLKCSALIVIVRAKVPNRKGKFMPEWEETAACACAVQNLHLMASAMGVAGYWSSGGVSSLYPSCSELREFLRVGADDHVLGVFHLGRVEEAKLKAYRASRGPVEEKITWLR